MNPQLLAQSLQAHKIPAVRLSQTQIAKLKELAPNDQILWYEAGLQSDGKTFVCLVTGQKNSPERAILLWSAIFDTDGKFH